MIILGKPVSSIELFTGFLIIPSLGEGMMSYTIEKWLEIRESQERLINSEKLESVSHLSSALAHEIRSPMTLAKGFMQLISSDDLNKEKKKEYTLIAVNELNRAETIIKEFLNYAKPSVNQFEYIYLAEGIKKVISLVEPLANKNAVQIMADCN